MKIEKRSIGTCIVLTIVTCGIYGIIWAVKMLREAVQVKNENDDGLVEILLGIFLCPVGFYLAEKKLTEGCQQRGLAHEDRSVLYLILGFIGLGIVDFILMQSDLNGLADLAPAGAPYQQPYQQPQDPAAYQQPQYQQPQYQQPQYQQPQYQQPQDPQQYQTYQQPQDPQQNQPPYQGGNQ